MITSYATFVNYFRQLAQQSIQLGGSFYVGDSWRIIAAQRSTITYPALWLEHPIITDDLASDGDTLRKKISFALSITGGQPTDDWSAQEARLNECREIMGKLVARLKKDSDANLFDLVFPMQAEPLATILADDQYGWRIEGEMDVLQWTECYHAEDWTGIYATGTTLPGGAAIIEDGQTLTIPAGYLLDLLIVDSETIQAVSVGTTAGGGQIMDAENVAPTIPLVHYEDVYALSAAKVLHFTCTGPITIRYRLISFGEQPTFTPSAAPAIGPGAALTIPAGFLLDVLVIESSASQNVSVGTSLGGGQILDNEAVTAASPIIHHEDVYAQQSTARTLYFTATDPITVRYRLTDFVPIIVTQSTI